MEDGSHNHIAKEEKDRQVDEQTQAQITNTPPSPISIVTDYLTYPIGTGNFPSLHLLLERSKCGLLGQCMLNGCPSDSSGAATGAALRQARQQERAGLAEWDELTGFGTMSTEGQQVKSELELDLT